MGVISELHETIDESLETYVQTIFTAVTDPVQSLLTAVAIVGLMYIALNNILQFRETNISSYLFWIVRYLIIIAFATIWANFKLIYDVFYTIPNDYAGLVTEAIAKRLVVTGNDTDIIDPSRIDGTYTGMDEFSRAIVNIAHSFLNDLSIFDIGKSIKNIFIGALILILGGFFVAASAITVIVAQVGFAVAVSMAPLAIIMLMLEQTRNYFDSWLRFTVGFLVMPLLTSGLVSILLFLAGEVLKDVDSSELFNINYLGFLLIMLASLFLLFQLPMMASTLASASVAAAGASTLMAGASMAKRAAISGAKTAYSGAQRARDGVDVASRARKQGASQSGATWAALNGMRQSSLARATRRDQRLEKRAGGGIGGIGNRNGAAGLVGEASAPAKDSGSRGNAQTRMKDRIANDLLPLAASAGSVAALSDTARKEKREHRAAARGAKKGKAKKHWFED